MKLTRLSNDETNSCFTGCSKNNTDIKKSSQEITEIELNVRFCGGLQCFIFHQIICSNTSCIW